MIVKSDYCDSCGKQKESYRLDTGGHSGVFLCKPCWSKEMRWRKQRNKKLSTEAKFDIKSYPKRKKK